MKKLLHKKDNSFLFKGLPNVSISIPFGILVHVNGSCYLSREGIELD